MTQWAVTIPADVWATERLFQHETLTVATSRATSPATSRATSPEALPAASRAASPDDEVLLVAGASVVALGRVVKETDGELVVGYTRRAFDSPVPAAGLATTEAVTALPPGAYSEYAARLAGDRDRTTWLVSVDLPIEAATPAEAVRLFWSYVAELGPAELPAFVSPSGNELAMQAFVLGEEANLDPEEDED